MRQTITDHRRVELQTFNSLDSNEIKSVALAMAPHKQTSGTPKYSTVTMEKQKHDILKKMNRF